MFRTSTLVCIGAVVLTLSASLQAKDRIVHEGIEWSRSWVEQAHKKDQPRILLIGDSILEGYYEGVKQRLGREYALARYATSKCVPHPDFLGEVKLLLQRYKFKAIHFNSGLHGRDYTTKEYKAGLRKLLKLFASEAPDAKLVWCATTPYKSQDNSLVIARNKAAAKVMKKNKIAINDLYTPVHGHGNYYTDGVHFNRTATGIQAKAVAATIRAQLK